MVHDLHAGALESFGIERRLDRNEGVRFDVLPELKLCRAQEGADVGLHVGRRDGEDVGTERARCAARDLIGGNAERDTSQLSTGECSACADDVRAAPTIRQSRSLELQQRS